jgi:hypothetical protein
VSSQNPRAETESLLPVNYRQEFQGLSDPYFSNVNLVNFPGLCKLLKSTSNSIHMYFCCFVSYSDSS